MADDKAAAEKVAEEKQKVVEAVEKRMTTGRPTPTQAELDKLALGQQVTLEPDGSEPDPKAPGWHKAALEGDKPAGQGGSYQTRASTARAAPTPHSTTHS
jgi:hypothetical protein